MKILITGVGGFIGFHTALKLLKQNKKVVGIDNINNFYDQKLKRSRIKILNKFSKKKIFYFLKKRHI